MKNNSPPLTIKVSFKNTIEDITLYNWICKNHYKSAFIKTVLREKMTHSYQLSTKNKAYHYR